MALNLNISVSEELSVLWKVISKHLRYLARSFMKGQAKNTQRKGLLQILESQTNFP